MRLLCNQRPWDDDRHDKRRPRIWLGKTRRKDRRVSERVTRDSKFPTLHSTRKLVYQKKKMTTYCKSCCIHDSQQVDRRPPLSAHVKRHRCSPSRLTPPSDDVCPCSPLLPPPPNANSTQHAQTATTMTTDGSQSNAHQVVVKHLDWQALVEFESCSLSGTAKYTFERVDPKAKTLCLDTDHLLIDGVTDKDAHPIPFTLYPLGKKPHLGSMLEISLPSESNVVSIHYRTTDESSALQWLPPSQTAGKKHPYLFTQCQAIHARSLVPCQDRPGVKMTWSASVTVPLWATCVMSALSTGTHSTQEYKTCDWNQPVPVSSYLIAMAVGDIAKIEISPRCAIWSEPSMVKAVAYEFAQTEEFLKDAETLAGIDYVWGRFDLLCLPPSFPYGGMENPCLTFVTPTLLAGDR